MDIFNAPSRENCTVRRERTNTPLQSLVTMNDEQFIEAARLLAQAAIAVDRRDFEKQLDFMTMRLVARPFDLKERAVAQRAYQDFLKHYDASPADAKKLLAVGEAPVEAGIAAPELAAMTMLANNLLNLDEVLNK
jgi:hypothetical protein